MSGTRRAYSDTQLGGELVGVDFDLAVEVRANAARGQRAYRDGEGAQDDERQQGRDTREANPDGQPIEAGGNPRAGAPPVTVGATREGRSRPP